MELLLLFEEGLDLGDELPFLGDVGMRFQFTYGLLKGDFNIFFLGLLQKFLKLHLVFLT